MPPLAAVFFDIGGTLADRDAAGRLVPFNDSPALLRAARESLGLRVGVITNLPATLSDDQIRAMLKDAGLLPFIDPSGLVTNHAAGADNPDPRIYQFAAARFGLMRRRKGVMCGSFAGERDWMRDNPFTMPHRSREGAHEIQRVEKSEV
jgi:FMN phosphatase YigB (HAD superfamily)